MPAVTLTVSIKIASSPSALELLTLFDTGHICSTSSAAELHQCRRVARIAALD